MCSTRGQLVEGVRTLRVLRLCEFEILGLKLLVLSQFMSKT